ncbi:hypothetical protein DKT77_12700 [Meridianimarinicoccus roseus]|uniref:Uncharacterized protein n=2 Tax=Meridianimarinicoccus roseus TaxID=2072018 RepID=A0A2V2LGU1_9RHOB|nr:hypothetical protein DKT77_12700 [Meridianimarinicoccus roseus]
MQNATQTLLTGATAMDTSTIRIAIRGLNEPWDSSRILAVIEEIAASLREEADIPARLTADSMTIAIDVATDRLPDAAALLRDLGLI